MVSGGVYNESKRGSLSFVILKQKVASACSGYLDFYLWKIWEGGWKDLSQVPSWLTDFSWLFYI